MFQWMKSSRALQSADHPQAVRQALVSLLNLTMVVEARDPYTAGHMWRVSRFARLLAQYDGLPVRDQALCELGGFVHDLGKVAIPDEILVGDGPLDEAKFAVMKTHPAVGVGLSDMQPLGGLVREAVRSHHERPDGQGYPDGLAADRIPVTAAVVGLADALDAMTSDRPYRRGMPMSRALGIVPEGIGTQFDSRWATVLLDQIPSAALEHVIGHSAEGVPLEACPMCDGPLARPADPAEPLPPCRICGAELAEMEEGIRPTGRRATAESLAPRPDRALIATLADSLVPHVQ